MQLSTAVVVTLGWALSVAPVQAEKVDIELRFSDAERRLIVSYYEELAAKKQDTHKKDKHDKHHKHDKHKSKPPHADHDNHTDYGHDKSTPPGLSKRQSPPPGHQKQLQRNGKLPPGLQGRGLPADLETKLVKLPEHIVRVQVGQDIVLMDQRTRLILDVIYALVH